MGRGAPPLLSKQGVEAGDEALAGETLTLSGIDPPVLTELDPLMWQRDGFD